MLEAADGFKLSSKPLREKMLGELRSLLKSSHATGIAIDVDHIMSAPALWNGVNVNVTASGELDPRIVWEIVWELLEAKFCLKLLMLDKHLVPEPVGESDEDDMMREIWYERDTQVHRCWPGLSY